MKKYPYLFVDTHRNSSTFGQWCIRWSESYSEDGFASKMEAMKEMEDASYLKEIKDRASVARQMESMEGYRY